MALDGDSRVVPLDRAIRKVRQEGQHLFEVFRRVAELCGEKPALQMSRDGRWMCYSYSEALDTTAAVARRLCELGLMPGDRVAICGENCPEWGLTYLAAMRAGLTAVPLDPQLPAEDIHGCCRFAEAKLIVAGRATFEAVSSAVEQASADDGHRITVIHMTKRFVPPPGASRDEGPPPVDVQPDHIASILFTSGTTVAPKAVPLTHANLLSNARALLEVHPLRSAERFVSVLPMYHVFEFTGGFLLPMIIGATVTYVEQLKAPEILTTIQAARPTIMLAVPSQGPRVIPASTTKNVWSVIGTGVPGTGTAICPPAVVARANPTTPAACTQTRPAA